LAEYDFLFFFNANCLFVDRITEDEFLPKNNLLVVQHPGYYNKQNNQFAYERNQKSTAYIGMEIGKYYICGGINGGRTKTFIKLARVLKDNIDNDYRNGIVAKWHDESHINHYIIDRSDFTLLSPSFCYPENWNLPFPPKILIRSKSKYIDINLVKNNKVVYLLKKIKKILIG
jgi:hypothetical protein